MKMKVLQKKLIWIHFECKVRDLCNDELETSLQSMPGPHCPSLFHPSAACRPDSLIAMRWSLYGSWFSLSACPEPRIVSSAWIPSYDALPASRCFVWDLLPTVLLDAPNHFLRNCLEWPISVSLTPGNAWRRWVHCQMNVIVLCGKGVPYVLMRIENKIYD